MASTTTDRRTGLSSGLGVKAPVRMATLANITLNALQTIDGVAGVAGDRVLVKNQTDPVDNGIWVQSTGDWTRDLDFDGTRDVVSATAVIISEGTQAGGMWRVSTTGDINPGTTSIAFVGAFATDSANITNTPAGSISATSTQGAVNELDADRIANTADIATNVADIATNATDIATNASAIAAIPSDISPVTATVAANALTVNALADTLDFRSSTLSNGQPVSRTFANLSMVVSSGSTLGTTSAVQSRIAMLVIDNAGTMELAVVNLAGGNNLDETTLITTVAEGGAGGADTANVIYSTTARSNTPFRVVGYVESTQAAAGTWATSPSTVQGAGGNALSAMGSIGYGQTWQDVSGSRVVNTLYYNTTGKPIMVSAALNSATADSSFEVDGVAVTQNDTSNIIQSYSFIVPDRSSYRWNKATGTIGKWAELR